MTVNKDELYPLRNRLDFPFKGDATISEWFGYVTRLEEAYFDLVHRMAFVMRHVPTEDGTFAFPDGEIWEAGQDVEETLNFARVQQRVAKWVRRNFGPEFPEWHPIFGVMEELGELCHSFLKQEQGIHQQEEHRDKMADAVADIIIFLADFCEREGFLMQGIMESVLPKVLARDWVAHREMYAADAEESVQGDS